ncbi:MAG: segregation/condensation protein A [Acidimicrobiia bacterium]|nr:segregation/condensation protein A [Acidimicrobiia bacterium]
MTTTMHGSGTGHARPATPAPGDPLFVDLSAYSGPIEVLLELISRRKLEIDEISVAAVVDDFVSLVDSMPDMPLEPASRFLLVAATLIHIKTNRLLPSEPDLELDDDLGADTERDVLLARILAARTFKDVSAVLQDHLDLGSRFVPRVAQAETSHRNVAPDLLRQVSADDLARVAARVLAGRPPERIDLSHVTAVKVSVGQAVGQICDHLVVSRNATFRELCRGRSIVDAVVRFLAVLELLKAGFVTAEQQGCFDDIDLTWIAPPGLTRPASAIEEYESPPEQDAEHTSEIAS